LTALGIMYEGLWEDDTMIYFYTFYSTHWLIKVLPYCAFCLQSKQGVQYSL